MTQLELQLEQKLKEREYNEMCSYAEQLTEEFENKYEDKEFEEYEVTEEDCTIDNLLDIIAKLNNRIENLVDDYNELLEDSVGTLEYVTYSIPCYEEI